MFKIMQVTRQEAVMLQILRTTNQKPHDVLINTALFETDQKKRDILAYYSVELKEGVFGASTPTPSMCSSDCPNLVR